MAAQWYDFHLHVERRAVRPFQTDDDDLCGFDSYDLEVGKRIRGWDSNACLRSTRRKFDGVPDDVLLEHLAVPTLSRRLRDALKRSHVGSKDLQYLPVHVFRFTGEELEGYAFANVITRISALDFDASEGLWLDDNSQVDPHTGKVRVNGILRAALLREKLEGHDVVRLVEFFPPVFVSERFVDVYRAGNFTGATFTPVIMM